MDTREHIRSDTAMHGNAILQEAIRLAADGELGNSDAIRLLQIPHRPEDINELLDTLDRQLSREAKSKLTLDALVPRPVGIDNQRYEPIFDKYLVTGRTYTTASGTVVPNELQYYNGEMVHLHGECDNVTQVNDALAGSGYRALTLAQAGGRETAIAQLWATRFTDSSIRPYSAMFIVVLVVGSEAPGRASFRADANGASSALAMLDGSLDPAKALYENTARLFMVRLLDTTPIAIEVGRERMGTDKRPGTIDMTRDGRRLRLSIADASGRGVVGGSLEIAGDPTPYLPDLARAAATAGIPFRVLPRGTEYCYPAVARIGRGPVVSWQWRSDLAPRLQPVMSDAVVFDPSSEEGRILCTWGFRPKVLGYIPNVRGVVTGLADQPARQPREAVIDVTPFPRPSTTPRKGFAMNHRARDGSVISWGSSDAPAPPFVADPGVSVPVTVAVSPIRPGHAVTVDYRVNGGPLRQVTALPEPRIRGVNARRFRAVLPGQISGLVEFLPVLRLAGQPMSPRLDESIEPPAYEVGRTTAPVDPGRLHTAASTVPVRQPPWAWDATFLGSLTAWLRKEVIGVTPDGLRIDWHVVSGSFVGPGIDAAVLPGAADWMRIREDGIGIVNVQACFETRTGARIYGSYGGHFDLGPDGYARALRDEYDALPPVVVTPTYATADTALAWLNRAQCIGVGRVDMQALRVEFDVYLVRVGERTLETSDATHRIVRQPVTQAASLYQRLGGYDVIAAVADDFIASIIDDRQLGRFFLSGYSAARVKGIRQQVVNLLCQVTGGSCFYMGRDMTAVHKGLGINDADWKTAVDLLAAALDTHKVPAQEQSEFLQIIEGMKSTVVERSGA